MWKLNQIVTKREISYLDGSNNKIMAANLIVVVLDKIEDYVCYNNCNFNLGMSK